MIGVVEQGGDLKITVQVWTSIQPAGGAHGYDRCVVKQASITIVITDL